MKRLTFITVFIALILSILRMPLIANNIVECFKKSLAFLRKVLAYLFAFSTKRVREHVEFTELTEK